MITLRGNRLLPLIALALVALVVLIITRTGGSDIEGESAGWTTAVPAPVTPAPPLAAVPQAPQPDADSPAEAVRTLSAQVTQMADTVQAWTKESEQLRKLRDTLRREIGGDVAEDIRHAQQRAREEAEAQDREALQAITARIDALAGRISLLDVDRRLTIDGAAAPMPPGLGFETGGAMQPVVGAGRELIWIEPLDGTADGVAKAVRPSAFKTSSPRLLERTEAPLAQPTAAAASSPSSSLAPDTEPRPIYTVPENASLMNATAFSALIGRVPVKGVVSDPFPFKVLVGADNLAANGIEIPGVYGAVFRGIATGDLNLRCVRGDLVSVTFVFDDGTIRTVRADGKDRLGSLSDRQGIGCVSGRLITNAPAYLAQRTLVMGLETGARAAAASETTSVVTATGATASSVTGSTGKFIAGEMVSGGASEIKRWLDERQGQSFDAIFVEPGAEVVLDIEREFHIDYDPHGRRTSHAQTDERPHRRNALD